MTEIPEFNAVDGDDEAAGAATIPFKLDGELFEAVAQIGGSLMMETMDLSFVPETQTLDPKEMTVPQQRAFANIGNQMVQRQLAFLDKVLLPESQVRFAARLQSIERPITLKQATQVYHMLVGRYGGNRPTGPSSPSSNGHDGTGPESTVSAPTEVSIPTASQDPGSLT